MNQLKKGMVVFGLLILALFVVSCSPRGDSGSEKALAGQAVGSATLTPVSCEDSDNGGVNGKYIPGYVTIISKDNNNGKYISQSPDTGSKTTIYEKSCNPSLAKKWEQKVVSCEQGTISVSMTLQVSGTSSNPVLRKFNVAACRCTSDSQCGDSNYICPSGTCVPKPTKIACIPGPTSDLKCVIPAYNLSKIFSVQGEQAADCSVSFNQTPKWDGGSDTIACNSNMIYGKYAQCVEGKGCIPPPPNPTLFNCASDQGQTTVKNGTYSGPCSGSYTGSCWTDNTTFAMCSSGASEYLSKCAAAYTCKN